MKFIFTILAVTSLVSSLRINKLADDCIKSCVNTVEARSPTCEKYGPDEDNIFKCVCQQDESYWVPLWECAHKCPEYTSTELTWEVIKPIYCSSYQGLPKEPKENPYNHEQKTLALNKRDIASGNDNYPFTLSANSTKDDFFKNNRYFVDSIRYNRGNSVFQLNGEGQSPHTLWIGCSDSRAGDQCLATLPGEIFVHRNIGNVINGNDISSQGVLQYAIDILKVKRVIVSGHTDCGAMKASLSRERIGGVLDPWLNQVRQLRANNYQVLQQHNQDPKEQAKKLAELNVIASVTAVKRHPSVLMALKEGNIEVWGMMYDVSTGYLSEVKIPDDEFADIFVLDEEHGH